jgi:DNA-binding transcriptional ArsR family regulator
MDSDRELVADVIEDFEARSSPRQLTCDCVRMPHEDPTRGRQLDGSTAVRSLEQTVSHGPLQRGDLLTHRRLRIAEPRRSADERALGRDAAERGQVAQLDTGPAEGADCEGERLRSGISRPIRLLCKRVCKHLCTYDDAALTKLGSARMNEDSQGEPDVLEITDVATMRVFTHPLRARILWALRENGPATATGLAQMLGESSGLMSYHLRQLAQHKLVVEDTERGRGRERWWKLAAAHFLFPEPADRTPEYDAELARVRDRILEVDGAAVAAFIANESSYSREWQDASLFLTAVVHVTHEELTKLHMDFGRVLEPWYRLDVGQRPPDALPVRVSIRAVPIAQPDDSRDVR